jgi:signal transduction histidine kinase/CheY-like chemotaxis protein
MMTSAHFFFINMEKGDLTVLQQSVTDWVVPFYALFLIVYMFKLRETLVSNVVLRIENEQASMNKSQFMAAASHDIRQPLQAANFYCEALKKQGETSHVLSQLGGCLDNMSILLDNILDVSKLDAQVVNNVPVHLSLADLFANLEREFRPLAQAKGLIISFEHNDSCVYADQILLERVLCNLISNAISYTLAGEVTVVAKSKAYSVEVSVTDTGIGIDKAEQQAIFDEFYQINNPERDRNKGLGLGLSIVKRHCELMHVELNMDSSLGKGARISLELKQGSNEKIKMPDEAEHQMNVQCKIALIDDEKIIRESLSAMLKEWDMQCMAFVDAESAMQYMTEQQWLPELIIADYRLKDHQTGSEAIKHICTELDCDIPALLLTGDTHPERIREAKATGFHVVHKPVKPATLRTAIHLMIK